MSSEDHMHSPPSPKSALPDHGGEAGESSYKQLRRACDCCRKRKVKCDGQDPCGPCKKASITCAYLQPPKKKGPKGLRSARVLHALRRIDNSKTRVSPTSPTSAPEASFSNWSWDPDSATQRSVNDSYQTPSPEVPLHSSLYAHLNSPDISQHVSYQQVPRTMPQAQQLVAHTSSYGSEPYQQQNAWISVATDPVSASSDGTSSVLSPPVSAVYHQNRLLAGTAFQPYVQLFFNHMFAIMPIIDRNVFLDPSYYTRNVAMNADEYSFLCSVCAATIVQLDASIQQPPPLHPSKSSDIIFAEECLRERQTFDFVAIPSILGVMTSYFLFAYYGNLENHAKAWHYLQESITTAESLNMEDESSYEKLDAVAAQWRRRLYWLLFITERAYAVQRRKHTRLRASVTLPVPFANEDPQLFNGFVNLANLFSAVDDSFVSAWRGSRKASLCDETWLARTQKQLDSTAQSFDPAQLTETQRLDIDVTREWLHVLAWQMGVSNGLIWGQGEGGMRLDYPVELARKVVEITSRADALALDSHGLGMEQKLSDIAGCLADVLRCTAGDTSPTFVEGKKYLNILLQRLSSIRGKESRYLKPLMTKLDGLMDYDLDGAASLSLQDPHPGMGPQDAAGSLPTAPAFNPPPIAPRWSMTDSMGMLRRLSMNSGHLGVQPGIPLPQEDWSQYQRRFSARFFDQQELEALQPWLTSVTSDPTIPT